MILKKIVNNFVQLRKIRRARVISLHRAIRILSILLVFLVLAFVWGVSPKNVWIVATSILGIFAIGFFAVWSILSSYVAGLFLLMADSIRIDDEIELVQSGIKGTVVQMKLMFVVLSDNENNQIYIPNNMFFQTMTKRILKRDNEKIVR